MSKHRNLGDHRGTNENSLVPLETIVELIESDVGPVQREHGGVSFDGTIGTTHIQVIIDLLLEIVRDFASVFFGLALDFLRSPMRRLVWQSSTQSFQILDSWKFQTREA